MRVEDSLTYLKKILYERYPSEGNPLFFPEREAIKTAIKVMELSKK